MAESNVPSLWVCEIHTCEHTSCPPRREPSDLYFVVDLMKRLSFAVSVTACSSHTCRYWKCTPLIPSSLSRGRSECIISVSINEPVTWTIGQPVKPAWLTGQMVARWIRHALWRVLPNGKKKTPVTSSGPVTHCSYVSLSYLIHSGNGSVYQTCNDRYFAGFLPFCLFLSSSFSTMWCEKCIEALRQWQLQADGT